jgi:acyl dehydratase
VPRQKRALATDGAVPTRRAPTVFGGHAMSLYYEDVEVGQVFESPGRTITEADVVAFAALSSDWNPIHTDAEFAKTTPFGRRIAHGNLGIAIATGLVVRLGLFTETTIAVPRLEWMFKAPLFIGDTVHVRMRIAGKRPTSKGDRGLVEREFQLVNQRGDVVQEGVVPLLIKARSPKKEA